MSVPSRSARAPGAGPLRRFAALLLLGGAAALVAACGGASAPAPYVPFVAGSPDQPVGPRPPEVPLPPPAFPTTPVWQENAFGLGRTALYGSFPSDLVAYGATLFTTDADQVEHDGATIVPIDVGGLAPIPSVRFAPTTILPHALVDSHGAPFVPDAPIGFGAFVNDLRVLSDDVGLALVSAGGSDSVPTLANLVVFRPTTGEIRQVIDLAREVPSGGRPDSTGAALPGPTFRQSVPEALAFVPTNGDATGRLFVAMANILFGAPSFGTVKYPGTVMVLALDLDAATPVTPLSSPGLYTTTFFTHGYNPSAVTRLALPSGGSRLMVTAAGTSAYDANWALVPASPASVEVYDPLTLDPLGRFDLGPVALSGARPAVGRDAVGHRVGFFASSILGAVYLLRLDGVYSTPIRPEQVAVLRGANNPIPIDPAEAGGPGGNVSSLGLSSDGRTLLASGFGDFFAFPLPKPGRLLALSLPQNLVTNPLFTPTYVPGTTTVLTTPGRTLGPLVVGAFHPEGPEVFVAVSGGVSLTTGLGTSPASLGTLHTFGRIR